MRYKRTIIDIIEIDGEGIDLDALTDSLQDDILNAQESEHETDDANWRYVPRELVTFKLEPYDEKG